MAAETLEVNDMLGQNFEPLRKFRWIVSIGGIEAFFAKSATRPQLTFGQTEIDYINQRRYIAGKGTWAAMTLTLNDPITPSASQQVMEWIRLTWENVTGRMGYAVAYYKDITLKMLDPAGSIVQQWNLQGTWIQDANFNDLDYTSDDVADITLTLRFNQAILEF